MGVVKNPLLLWLLEALEWLSYHSATHMVSLSPGIKRGIEKRGIKTQKIEMIPNGCDLELFNPQGDRQSSIFRRYEFSRFAIFSGAHGVANGLDQLLNVAAELKFLGRTDISILFVGEGSTKEELISEAKARKLDNCIFLNPIPKVELAALFRAADVGLMVLAEVPAFYYGTSPNKFFDYISSGLPVINNYPGWIANLIKESRCGAVIPSGECRKFAAKIIEICNDDNLRHSMARASRQLAESGYSRARLAGEFVDLLEAVDSRMRASVTK
jgi:glycosyltransferase involved in cell wall biosynthesis